MSSFRDRQISDTHNRQMTNRPQTIDNKLKTKEKKRRIKLGLALAANYCRKDN